MLTQSSVSLAAENGYLKDTQTDTTFVICLYNVIQIYRLKRLKERTIP